MYRKIKEIRQKQPKYFYLGILGLIFVFAILGFGLNRIIASDAPLITNIELEPPLDLSRFASYDALATIDRFPQAETATVTLEGINGDGGDHWDYLADGTGVSQSVVKNMSYDSGVSKWRSTNIYPDTIYPEIYFMPSSITWNNAPLNLTVRRNNYQLMHIANPYTSTGDMSFWIEVNALKQSGVNSANLQVYLIEKGHDINYFQQDWRALPGVELVGAITKDATPNHVHTTNSSHHIIHLSSNSDGSFGIKNLDINGDFWILLYSTSPNNDRGYNLRYQPSSLCNNNNRWYSGSQSGWTTSLNSGCPDAHVHLARRSSIGGIRDGVKSIVTASYGGETGTKTTSLYYNTLPNMAPNATVFRNPVLGGTYSGDVNVTWDPATDANNDPLKYTVYLYDSNNNQVGEPLITDTSSTNFTWSTNIPGSEVPNGNYYLKGKVCDQGIPTNEPPDAPLCTDFLMPRTFTVDNSSPIKTINSISINSSNHNKFHAKAGDTVTLSFTASAALNSPTVGLYTGGNIPINDVSLNSSDNLTWNASYLVSASGRAGEVSFEIHSTNLDKDYYETTDSSKVTVDLTAPTVSNYSPSSGIDKVISTANLVMTFDENIQPLSGKKIVIKKSSDNTVVESISPNDSAVTVNGSIVTINPTSDLTDKTSYYVQVDQGSFSDTPGNEFAGINDEATWHFTVGDITKPKLNSVKISSNNSKNNSYAAAGDTVTLLFEASEEVNVPTVEFRINDKSVTNTPIITNTTGNYWTAVFDVDQKDPEGTISFKINLSDVASNAADEIISTTDSSGVMVTAQAIPISTSTMAVSPTQNPTLTSTLTAILTKTAEPSKDNTQTSSDTTVNEQSVSTTSTTSPAKSHVTTSPESAEYGSVLDLYNLKLRIIKGDKSVAGAKVELYSNVRQAMTDVNGEVEFANVEAGVHKIKIYSGKNIIERDISVIGEDNTLNININITDAANKNWMLWLVAALGLIILCFLILRQRIKKLS